MSLAPASIRGFFLNARFAVNGIQCAARSFGTLTELGRGVLSSMSGRFSVSDGLTPNYQFCRGTGTPARRDISAQYAGSEIGGGDPEYFALGILGIEPEQRQLWIGGLELRTTAADLAQQAAPRRQARFCLVEDAPDDIEAVGAAVEGELRLGAAFAGQVGHAFSVHIGRI